jgi:hypothetical protein
MNRSAVPLALVTDHASTAARASTTDCARAMVVGRRAPRRRRDALDARGGRGRGCARADE